ncbi:transposase IS6110 [Mycobacterium tuberculosis RGTB423]|nr:transposase IS6110 [Mycobacterium tuberculosis RGTB423]
MRWGVESICTQLTELGVPIAPSTYYDHINREPSRRELRDGELKEHISRVHAANYGVYGARKVWLTLNREGIEVARCTVERLMTKLGLSGTTRGKARRTTIADPATARPADLVQRRFGPPAPNRLWVADLTYVSTWAGFAYVAFVTDAYARRILGWRVASTMATSMVLDAIEQAIWTRQQEGVLDLKDVIHHTDRGSQYTSIRFSERLAEAGIQPSVGAVGSSYDNALAETINGLYKTELIKPGKPWRSIEDVELATARWVDWFNHRRLYQYCGDVPPVELEAAYYAPTPETSRRLRSQIRESPDSPGRFDYRDRRTLRCAGIARKPAARAGRADASAAHRNSDGYRWPSRRGTWHGRADHRIASGVHLATRHRGVRHRAPNLSAQAAHRPR